MIYQYHGSSYTGTLNFEKVNKSEPIYIEIKPVSENITCLYPRNNLYPDTNLFMTIRTLRFFNTTSNEIFDYELPDNLLFYDSQHYDSFILDYSNQKCIINKMCKYNENGEVVLLQETITEEFEYPNINLTDGDYTIEVLKYEDGTKYNAYLSAKLMGQNPYTKQFATEVQVNSEIQQTTQELSLSVNEELKKYATKEQMNSKIEIKSNEINSTVSKKVGKDEVISSINQSSEAVSINANKISLNGKNIDLTGDNVTITSNNFNVDENGNMSCQNAQIKGSIESNNATITGGKINISGDSSTTDLLRVTSSESDSEWSYIAPVSASFIGEDGRIDIVAAGSASAQSYIDFTGTSGYTIVKNSGIRTPTVTQTSKQEEKKNFEKLTNALEILKGIDIYKYNFKNEDNNDKKHIGFVIGKDFNYREEVTSKDNDGVDIYSFISTIGGAVQELELEVKNLREEIERKGNKNE